tara:strand:- start:847 stop:1062 length:216 start_codon:yes stop_codon:yes gene_type:complete
MDRKELIEEIQKGILDRFMELDEADKNLIRSSSGTPYAVLMRKIIGEEILSGLRSGEPTGESKQKRGLGTR